MHLEYFFDYFYFVFDFSRYCFLLGGTLTAMSYHYHAFGLSIESDFPIQEFLESPLKQADLSIQQSDTLSGPSSSYYIEGAPNQLLLQIPEVACFLIEKGHSITYTLAPNASMDTFRLFLLGSAMGALLQQRGYIVLHGNAISTDGKSCKIFVGKQGAGKSTTAAWHYLQGAKILADDVCAVGFTADGHPYVLPSYPQLKLWQTSADLLNINTQHLRQIREQCAKFALPILDRFFNQALPISHIIEIDKDHLGTKKLLGAEKLMLLKNHSYRYHFVCCMGGMAHYAKSLMQLASKVQILSKERIQIQSSPKFLSNSTTAASVYSSAS
jgi:hypothetical protein